MKAMIVLSLAAIGFVATPAFANTSALKTQRVAAHRTVAQVCQSERQMANNKKESWKLANQHCQAAKQTARASIKQAKMAANHAKAVTKATKAPTKG